MGHQGFAAWPDATISNVSVGTSSTLLLAANEYRQAVYLSNPTANPVWLNFGAAAVADQGIPLGPGAVMAFNLLEDQRDAWQRKVIYGIAVGSVAGISVFEQEHPPH